MTQYTNEAYSKEALLNLVHANDKTPLYTLAHQARLANQGSSFETCSIINARSGLCQEDCKWCSQSKHFATGVPRYALVKEEEILKQTQEAASYGVDYFSLVTSGRGISQSHLDTLCASIDKVQEAGTPINMCASMGLISKEKLQQLYNHGVRRYHCNLETSPRMFPKLVTTHTMEEKIEVIQWAKEIGMTVCSGGIIGMGETMEDRIDMALLLRELEVDSVVINILMPVPGTPLADAEPLSEEEIRTTLAMFKIACPKAMLRIAGGRKSILPFMEKTLYGGVSALLTGNYLTTVGCNTQSDMEMISRVTEDLKKAL